MEKWAFGHLAGFFEEKMMDLRFYRNRDQ